MPLNNRPLVPIALSYICGIVFARYFYIPWWICLLLILIPNKKIRFYFYIIIFGYLTYQLHPQYDLLPKCDFLKGYIRRIIYYNFPYSEGRNLLTGLLLGERHRISKEVFDVLRYTNTMHILAISGLHIGFIGMMLFGILRLILVPRKISALLAILFVLVYVSMVGWRPPAFRAAVMFIVLAIGWIIDRPNDPINSLSLAAIIVLLIAPQTVFEAGFQLSFIIALGLLIFVPVVKGQYLKKAFWTSTIAWLCSLPLVAYYFRVISPVSILANLIIIPGISIVIALGFTSIILGSVCIGISGIFNTVNFFLINGVLKILHIVSKIPYGYFYVKDFPVYLVFVSYIVIGIVLFSLLQKRDIVIK